MSRKKNAPKSCLVSKGKKQGCEFNDDLNFRKHHVIVEGYTDGTLWNGWANVCFTREQVSAWLDASPYDYRFLEPKTKLNKRDYPVLLIYFDDREEIIESTPLPTDSGDILEGYFMESYCFVEIEQV